jgi:alpha-D-xyloside xylohydrolase
MQTFHQDVNALICKQLGETIRIEPWGQDSLRVRSTVNPQIDFDTPGGLLKPTQTEVQINIGNSQSSIRNGNLMGIIDLREDPLQATTPAIRYINVKSGEELLAETSAEFPRPAAREYKPIGGSHYRVEARFKSYPNEKIFGLGQHQHGHLNQKGVVIDQFQINTEICIPFLLSNRGYGFLWHNPAVGRVELGVDRTRWVAESTLQFDYWITTGETPADILKSYAEATGYPPMLPEWAAGFWQCKLRYRNQEELLAVAREHKQRELPMSVIIADFFHWTNQGDWEFDPQCWPDPTAMVTELSEMGIRLMVSVWPTVSPHSRNFQTMMDRKFLVNTRQGVAAHMFFRDTYAGPTYTHYYDPTHPEARRFVWEQVREGYYKHGIKVWWLDACEPEINPRDPENLIYHLGDGLAVTNLYPLLNAQAFYDGMKSEGEDDVVLLCRSAWAGSQRYGAIVWSGDIQSTFEALQKQVRAGLNAGLSGIPWWTTDIGGFFGGDIDSPYFRELIVRWFQFGVFCPIFHLHGFRLPNDDLTNSGGPNEVWSFGEEAYKIIKDLLFLRERLKPYIMEQMKLAQDDGIPPMRPLFFDFPDDTQGWEIEDQFMFGPDLLVAPVLYEGAFSRKVYLPSGITWRDAWTEEIIEGGQWIEADAPLEHIPLYLRGEAILPVRDNHL